MAAAPVKQLHNFPLSLKWGSQTQPYHPDSDSDQEQGPPSTRPTLRPPPTRVGSRSARHHRYSFASCSNSLAVSQKLNKQEKPNKAPPQKRSVTPPDEPQKIEAEGEEEEENLLRPWKLRPRRQNGSFAFSGATTAESKDPSVVALAATEPKSMRLRGMAESGPGNGLGGGGGGIGLNMEIKKEKRKIWIALSREEIEEDVFILTGSRPPRRPRKRPKNVQKQLDSVFPGLWLVGTAADSYRFSETFVKR